MKTVRAPSPWGFQTRALFQILTFPGPFFEDYRWISLGMFFSGSFSLVFSRTEKLVDDPNETNLRGNI